MDDDADRGPREVAALMPFLHLPVQSGSDRMLARDEPRSTRADDYLRLIERLRAARPDIALSSDFIVGFPGESEADFEATLALVARGRLRRRPSRSNTARARARRPRRMDDQVPDDGQGRAPGATAGACSAEQQAAFNRACVGRTLPVLFEQPRPPSRPAGRPQPLSAGGARRGARRA